MIEIAPMLVACDNKRCRHTTRIPFPAVHSAALISAYTPHYVRGNLLDQGWFVRCCNQDEHYFYGRGYRYSGSFAIPFNRRNMVDQMEKYPAELDNHFCSPECAGAYDGEVLNAR